MGKNYLKHKEWLHTKKGRASTLVHAYNHKDEKLGRGKGDLTSEWVVDNIFTKSCVYCGESEPRWSVCLCHPAGAGTLCAGQLYVRRYFQSGDGTASAALWIHADGIHSGISG